MNLRKERLGASSNLNSLQNHENKGTILEKKKKKKVVPNSSISSQTSLKSSKIKILTNYKFHLKW